MTLRIDQNFVFADAERRARGAVAQFRYLRGANGSRRRLRMVERAIRGDLVQRSAIRRELAAFNGGWADPADIAALEIAMLHLTVGYMREELIPATGWDEAVVVDIIYNYFSCCTDDDMPTAIPPGVLHFFSRPMSAEPAWMQVALDNLEARGYPEPYGPPVLNLDDEFAAQGGETKRP